MDLTTLSPNELARYGLPGAPSDPRNVGMWRDMLAHAKQRDCTGVVGAMKHTTRNNSKNYAGNLGNSGGYSAAWVKWNNPCPTSPSNSVASPWAGIGGYNPGGNVDRLIQAGEDIGINSNGSRYYNLWVENAPDASIYDTSFHPGCTDTIYAIALNTYLGHPWAFEEVEDVDHGVYFSRSQQSASYVHLSSVSAEWIVEGFVHLGIPLTNFGSVTFYTANATRNGSTYAVGSLPHDYDVMCTESIFGICGAGATQLAHPGPISGSTFTVYWDHSS